MILRLLGLDAGRMPTFARGSAHRARSCPRNPIRLALLTALACAWAPAAIAQATSLTRHPYLQRVTEQSALVAWRTATAAPCTLTYQTTGGTPATITTPAATEHVATLGDLQPDTVYEYAIHSGGLLAGGAEYTIHTAPPPNTRPVRFLAWGDSGEPSASLSAIAAMVAGQSVDLALLLGDIVLPDGRPSYQDPRHFDVFRPLLRHTPAWATPGNHDYPYLSTYLESWYLPTNPVDGSELYYSFDYGDIHFVSLDTNEPFTPAILGWLAADLGATTRRWKVVFYHHTIYSCGSAHGSDLGLINALGPVFDAGGVDLAFCGHDHHFERSYPMHARQVVGQGMNPDYVNPGGTIYVVSGATASPRTVYTSCTHTARAFKTPSVARVEVDGDLLTLEAVGTSGEVLDRMTLRKSGGPPPPVETLQVLNPRGGEQLTIGDQLDVEWTSSASVGPVRIEISRDGGAWETLFPSTANDGSESWTVAGPASQRCWLRISEAADGMPVALCNEAFAIRAAEGGGDPPNLGLSINFQPASTPVPSGYVADTGQFFDAVRGYGWNASVSLVERGLLLDNPRDTFAEAPSSDPPVVWEMAVADGNYRVALMCGDPQAAATHRVALEGQVVIEDVPSAAGEYVERIDIPVVVRDGRLTVTVGGGPALTSTKLNALAITGGLPTEHALVYPAGGERFCTGTNVQLRWTGATAGVMVRIDLSRNGDAGPWEPRWITADVGSATWTVVGPAAEECCLRLRDLEGQILAQSAAPFTILEPKIQVVAPNGGEVWGVGTEHSFQWTNACLTGDVRIDVSRAGPDGPWSTLIPVTANDGNERWTVRPEDVGWTYVRIQALPFGIPADRSDAPFAVVENPPPRAQGWHIDFHPAGALTALGYDADAGLPYSAERGYGWDDYVRMKQRDLLPGDARDSFVQVKNTETATWRIPVPIGEYRVALVCGDPLTSGTHRVEIENQRIVDDVYASGGNFVTRDTFLNVPDGELTMTLGGSGEITSTKVCYIEIEPATGAPGRGRRGREMLISELASAPARDRLVMDGGPWRGPVSFTLELAGASRARLEVHDVRGRRIATLHDGELPSGRHAFTWQAGHPEGPRLASGVYFLRLETAACRETYKLLVIR